MTVHACVTLSFVSCTANNGRRAFNYSATTDAAQAQYTFGGVCYLQCYWNTSVCALVFTCTFSGNPPRAARFL